MSRFFAYDPNQAYLLPPNVKDVLGGEHSCFRLHAMVEQFDLSQFEQAYGAEGRLAYPPSMMLTVWLYAFCLGVNSTRRLERRMTAYAWPKPSPNVKRAVDETRLAVGLLFA